MRLLPVRFAALTPNRIAMVWGLAFLAGLFLLRVWPLGLLLAIPAVVVALVVYNRLPPGLRVDASRRLWLALAPFICGLLLRILPGAFSVLAALAVVGLLVYLYGLPAGVSEDEAADFATQSASAHDLLATYDFFMRADDWSGAARVLEEAGDHAAAYDAYVKIGNTLGMARMCEALARYNEAVRHYCKVGLPNDVVRVAVLAGGGAVAMAAKSLQDAGHYRAAVGLYERTEDWANAAALYRRMGEYTQAARLYERAGMLVESAEAWKAAGEHGTAASTFARAGAYASALAEAIDGDDGDAAVAAFAKVTAGQIEKMVRPRRQKLAALLARAGQYADAAEQYRSLDEHEEAASNYLLAAMPAEAADSYEHAGNLSRAAELRLRLGERDRAAHLLVRAGRHGEAAQIYRDTGQFKMAAASFAAAGLFAEAGAMYVKAKQYADAALAYDKVPDRRSAARCYEAAEMYVQSAVAYVSLGAYAEAGENYRRAGEYLKAVECFANGGLREKVVELCPLIPNWRLAYSYALDFGAPNLAMQIVIEHQSKAPAAEIAEAYLRLKEHARALPFCLDAALYEEASRICTLLWDRAGTDIKDPDVQRAVDQIVARAGDNLRAVVERVRPPFLRVIDGEFAELQQMKDIDDFFAGLMAQQSFLRADVLIEKLQDVTIAADRDPVDMSAFAGLVSRGLQDARFNEYRVTTAYLVPQYYGIGAVEQWVLIGFADRAYQFAEVHVGARVVTSGRAHRLEKCLFYFPVSRQGGFDPRVNDEVRGEIKVVKRRVNTQLTMRLEQVEAALMACFTQIFQQY